MTNRFTDRSRMLAYQRCPRARYFEYEWDGTGVRKKAHSIPLATGGSVHVGLACLLMGADTESAVEHSLADYRQQLAGRGLSVSEGESEAYVAVEQMALTEALVRMWAIVGLPSLLKQFQVIQVEQELTVPLGDVTMMSRPDAVLCERETGDLYVLSFKTAAQFDRRKQKECEHDDQGISEVVAVEHAMGEKVMGVRYEFLLKGNRKEYPEGSGRWVQWSPLIRAYRKAGVTSAGDEFAANYQWKDGNGNTRRLGKGWERYDVWQPGEMGIKGWVEWLQGNDYGTLESQLVVPPPFYRHQEEVDSWVTQRTAQEGTVEFAAQNVEEIRVNHRENFLRALDFGFPQNRRSCDYPGPCQFQDICFGPVSPADPLSDSSYERREPHHAPELDQRRLAHVVNGPVVPGGDGASVSEG